MGFLGLLVVAGVAFAQSNFSSGVYSSSVGGALPPGVAAPNTSGFENPVVLPSRGGGAVCVSGFVRVTASARNLRFNFRVPQNQTDATETFLKYFAAGSTFPAEIMGGMQTVQGTYRIGATLCTPGRGTAPTEVEILTHGVGFDRTYWDFAPGYSYVDVAARYGHATFFYDRLGVGLSAKEDPLNTVQTPLEVEIANQLIIKLRQGSFSNISFSKVVGAGHSFGSIITQAVTSKYPTALDGAILTGFSLNMTAVPAFIFGLNLAIASINQPIRFAALPPGYLVSDTVISNQIGFFKANNFDPNILSASEATKGLVTYGELFSLTAATAPATAYSGPVAVVDGSNDLPFCFGNCSYPSNQAAAVKSALYSNLSAAKFDTYLVPNTGHGINLHYSAVPTYEWIENFLKKQGL